MGQRVSLFSGYEQGENRTTNYCVLLLQMLYAESPGLLGDFLSNLVGDEIGSRVGVQFLQQTRKGSSVPDGLIFQDAFHIYIETKRFDWFYDSQLENHLDNLNNESTGLKVLLALSNYESDISARFSQIENLCKTKYSGAITFRAASFEEFLSSIPWDSLSRSLRDVAMDFRNYLDSQGLLPRWRDLLDVVNCVQIPGDIQEHNVYMCPVAGGAYNHSRCRYFGMYGNKRVGKVALIRALVDVHSDDTAQVQWVNVDENRKSLEEVAFQKVRDVRKEYPTRVFVLGKLYDTDFVKDSRGGMMASKQYFDVSPLHAADAADLAQKLKGKTWTWLANQAR